MQHFRKVLVAVTLQLTFFANAKIPQLAGWRLVFSDDFSGTRNTLPSAANWIIDTGTSYPGGDPNWGNAEVQSFTASPANVAVSGNGVLNITPRRSSSGQWTSGRIETKRDDFMAPAGQKMMIRGLVSMPNVNTQNGEGYWPSFWTLGGAYRGNYHNWPKVGEFDIMENVNGIDQVWSGIHCGVNPGGVCDEPVGLVSTQQCPRSACQGHFHTYTVVVDRSVKPEVMTYSVDGSVTRVIKETDLGAATWAQIAHHGHFIILDVAIGGDFPNAVAGYTTPTSNTVSGKPMKVGYVAVYYSNPKA